MINRCMLKLMQLVLVMIKGNDTINPLERRKIMCWQGQIAGDIFALLLFLTCIFIIIPFWKIFQRSGHSGWWSLTQIVPFLNIFILFFLAYGKWPTMLK